MGGLSWDGWTLLGWVDFAEMGRLCGALGVCFRGSGAHF